MIVLSHQHIFESIPDYIWITDKGHRYIAGSEKSAKLLGFHSLDHMRGKSLQDIPCDAKLSAHELCKQRDYVLTNQQTIEVLDIHPYVNSDVQIHYAKRHPFYNETNELIGVLVIARKLNHKIFAKLIYSLTESDKKFHNKTDINRSYELLPNGNEKLTIRELECYFYLLRGYSLKQIAQILSRSKRTIEMHINNIKVKMQCGNKTDLIEQGFLTGILHKFPLTLIRNLSIVL